MNDDKKLVLFDGVCNLCSASVQFIVKHDKKNQFHFATLQGKTVQSLKENLHFPAGSIDSFLLLENGNWYDRSTAALRVLKHLGNGWQFFYSFIIIPKFLRDQVYNIIARKRYKWFGKKDSCWIPNAKLKEKFLD